MTTSAVHSTADSCSQHSRGTKLTSQSRNMVMSVFKFIAQGGWYETMTDVLTNTAVATGVSMRTVQHLKQLNMTLCDGIFRSPKPKKRTSTVVDQVDNFDRECIKREILSFYERGELPTISSLLERIKEPPVNFRGSRSSLYKLVRIMGFRFRKVMSGRKFLMERSDIVNGRNKYLREIKIYRESLNPRPEVYLDETWVNQNLSIERCWTNEDGTVGPKLKSGKGARFIMIHAGGSHGFIDGAFLMFKSKNGAKGDYHDSMDCKTFKFWFENQLLPNINNQSLIIMDNAPYHSKILNKVPTISNKKCQILQWLESNKIDHDPAITKLELLKICKLHKEREIYEIDQIAANHGHKVLRLPPYHCMFNPIELIWAQVKTEIKKGNSHSSQSLKNVEKITQEAINHVTPHHWQNAMRHVRKIETDYRAKDAALDHLLDQFIINIESDESMSEDEMCV
ncbi:uncharacterized protein [Palaemon carinicauda]|uniref:uncharacterized protein n=1 Tax=Palaemon carinicauda TaxID=392227 RepID=UPI0035B608DB